MCPRSSERGIALLIVVSVLTVVAIMGVSFVFSMFLETQAARQFVASTQSRYIAEAGVTHGWVVLEEDELGSRYDDLREAWVDAMSGADVDVDEDDVLDARWWLVANDRNEVVGRYGVLIRDEAGKVNLNAALADPTAHGVDGVGLTSLFSKIGVPTSLAASIESYRFGEDGQPGKANIDDDGDGTVDEPDEYQPLALRGDDRRFENLEEVLSLSELDEATFTTLSGFATVYSWDPNLSIAGAPRLNVNTAPAEEILNTLLEKGGANPWQLAANMADYIDTDFALSKVVRHSTPYEMPNQGDQGSWSWEAAQPQGYYATDPSDSSLVWALAVPLGSFRVIVRGLSGAKVGDVTINGESRPSLDADETFGTLELTSQTMTVEVVCGEPEGVSCAFRGLELVPTEPPTSGGTVVRGVEAVRFNELMVSPIVELSASAAVFSKDNSEWSCDGSMCTNSGTGTAQWEWTTTAGQPTYVPPGKYHLRVYGQSGSGVGKIEGSSTVSFHGARHDEPLIVVEVPQADEQQPKKTKFSLSLGKTAGEVTYYFQKVSLSVEPDGEYVEFINLSEHEVDVSRWTIEGIAATRTVSLPEGAAIPAHGVLVAAVDVDDTQPGLENDITALAAWEMRDDANVVQLEFLSEEGSLSPDMDWLISTLPPDASSARLVLKDRQGWIVDEIEYPIPLPTSVGFQSLEKGDPTVVRDDDKDGLDEDWYPSLKQYTPGDPNDNEGLLEVAGEEQVRHDPSAELTILNRPLGSLGELAGLASSVAWKPVASRDLAIIADQLTVDGLRLESQAAELASGGDRWHETVSGYETSGGSGTEAVGVWEWTDIPEGTYRLSLYGWSGETMAVRWSENGEWTPARVTDAQGRLLVGELTVGMGVSDPKTLHLEVRCESESHVCHFLHAMLDPQLVLVGRINVNTASREVLLSLSGMTEAIVDRIIEGRPYGDQDSKARGIGDVLVGSALGETEDDRLSRFRQLANWLTVRSQVFQVMSMGEAFERNKPAASKRIQAILQR
ncbi:MAG: general secretion pathway protein GspK [Candidatus Omnitrophica bacterium]|nr:general secretion pathway protein GspK [Candidatus Omnitrophota bacterium]